MRLDDDCTRVIDPRDVDPTVAVRGEFAFQGFELLNKEGHCTYRASLIREPPIHRPQRVKLGWRAYSVHTAWTLQKNKLTTAGVKRH